MESLQFIKDYAEQVYSEDCVLRDAVKRLEREVVTAQLTAAQLNWRMHGGSENYQVMKELKTKLNELADN